MENTGKFGATWIEGFTKAAMANGADADTTKQILKVAALIDGMRDPKFMEGFSKVAEAAGIKPEDLVTNALLKEAQGAGKLITKLMGGADDLTRLMGRKMPRKVNLSGFADDASRIVDDVSISGPGARPVPMAKPVPPVQGVPPGYVPKGSGTRITPEMRQKAMGRVNVTPEVREQAINAVRDTSKVNPAAFRPGGPAGDITAGVAKGTGGQAGGRSLMNKLLWNPVTAAGAAGAGVYGLANSDNWMQRNWGRNAADRSYYDLMQLADEGKIPYDQAIAMVRNQMGAASKGRLGTLGFKEDRSAFNPYVNWFGSR